MFWLVTYHTARNQPQHVPPNVLLPRLATLADKHSGNGMRGLRDIRSHADFLEDADRLVKEATLDYLMPGAISLYKQDPRRFAKLEALWSKRCLQEAFPGRQCRLAVPAGPSCAASGRATEGTHRPDQQRRGIPSTEPWPANGPHQTRSRMRPCLRRPRLQRHHRADGCFGQGRIRSARSPRSCPALVW